MWQLLQVKAKIVTKLVFKELRPMRKKFATSNIAQAFLRHLYYWLEQRSTELALFRKFGQFPQKVLSKATVELQSPFSYYSIENWRAEFAKLEYWTFKRKYNKISCFLPRFCSFLRNKLNWFRAHFWTCQKTITDYISIVLPQWIVRLSFNLTFPKPR